MATEIEKDTNLEILVPGLEKGIVPKGQGPGHGVEIPPGGKNPKNDLWPSWKEYIHPVQDNAEIDEDHPATVEVSLDQTDRDRGHIKKVEEERKKRKNRKNRKDTKKNIEKNLSHPKLAHIGKKG